MKTKLGKRAVKAVELIPGAEAIMLLHKAWETMDDEQKVEFIQNCMIIAARTAAKS